MKKITLTLIMLIATLFTFGQTNTTNEPTITIPYRWFLNATKDIQNNQNLKQDIDYLKITNSNLKTENINLQEYKSFSELQQLRYMEERNKNIDYIQKIDSLNFEVYRQQITIKDYESSNKNKTKLVIFGTAIGFTLGGALILILK